jgi:hypothetical protein
MESNPQSFSTKQTFRECPQMQGRIPPNQRASARYTPKSEGGCKTTIWEFDGCSWTHGSEWNRISPELNNQTDFSGVSANAG